MSSSSSRSATSKPSSGRKTHPDEASQTASSAAPKKRVACPQCGTMVEWDPQNRYRPFCSERCKMIDLGAWANESYRVPVAEDDGSVDPDPSQGEPPSRN
jgi:endogenous inhibitor of DNA gyrase (YacG/DUF329 family)